MSVGIRLHDTAPGTLSQRARFAREQGFSCVHLALSKVLGPELMEPTALTPGLASHVRAALAPLETAVLGCYLNLACPDEAEYERTVAKYVAHLRFASWLGGCVVGTETGNPNAAYRYDLQTSHTEEALAQFIRRLRPVVRAAEQFGVVLAIEPVYVHIVSTPERARRVLDAIGSPNLQIILDPVNLLHPDNLSRRETVLREAVRLLGEATAVLHVKDYVLEGGAIRSVAAGRGEMDYRPVFDVFAKCKPYLHMTLEDTTPQNAAEACAFVKRAAGLDE